MATQPIALNTDLKTDEMSDFQKWKKVNGDDFSIWDYLSGVANVEVALAFTKLFCPDLVEHDGGIFLSEAFNQEIYEQWKAELGNDIAAIERVMNHQHIDDLLPGAESVGIDNLFYLGQVIQQMWDIHLKARYPDRTFQVSCNQDEYTVVVTFCQNSPYQDLPTKVSVKEKKEKQYKNIKGSWKVTKEDITF
jgi:hypothetical protein